MEALFACTRCNSRHLFEELSPAEQLCKECRNAFPVVKCTYCRAEFQQKDKGSTNTICVKCAENVKAYGKPSNCEYCNILAAFIGNRCQRCSNSERKWGPPQTCEQCKQRCAFYRSEEAKKKVDGKLLCWLCTLVYKRVLAKAKKQREAYNGSPDNVMSSVDSQRNNESTPNLINDNLKKETKEKDDNKEKKEHRSNHHHSHRHHHHHKRESSRSTERGKSHREHKEHKEHKSHHHRRDHSKDRHERKSKTHHSNHKSHEHSGNGGGGGSVSSGVASKKPKLERSTSNGLTPTKSSSVVTTQDATTTDPTSTDHIIAITQLREEVEMLKKQLQQKDQEMFEKEKKLTELKAKNYETEKELRTKLTSMQKSYTDQVESLQAKNRQLQKDLALLQKGKKIMSPP